MGWQKDSDGAISTPDSRNLGTPQIWRIASHRFGESDTAVAHDLRSAMTSVSTVQPFVEQLSERFLRLSDHIWGTPELRWQEHTSMQAQVDAAEEFGARIERSVAGLPTAFTAEWGSGEPVIAFVGEFDALAQLSQKADSVVREPDPDSGSGNGHGCGHNLLGAGSMLAAVALARHLERENLSGTVRYYGCPAEEAAAGKSYMVAAGAFDGLDAAISWHPVDVMTTQQWKSLAYTQVFFRFTGLAAHASAAPHLGRSALDAAELMNIGVNYLREHTEDFERIHYAYTDAGGPSANVVQPTSELYYVVRSPTVAKMQALYERVVAVAHGAAMMTATTVEIEFDGASAEILPNFALESLLHDQVVELGGVPFDEADQAYGREIQTTFPQGVVADLRRRLGLSASDDRAFFDGILPLAPAAHRPQLTGSTDVGDVSWVVPTVQISGGTAAMGTPPHSWQMVGQGKSSAAHKGLVHAAIAMAATALELITDPSALAAARTEFDGKVRDVPYVSPIPAGTVAPPLRGA